MLKQTQTDTVKLEVTERKSYHTIKINAHEVLEQQSTQFTDKESKTDVQYTFGRLEVSRSVSFLLHSSASDKESPI